MRYFLLTYGGELGAELEGQYPLFASTVKAPWACPDCHGPLPGHRLEDVRLSDTPIGPQPLVSSSGLSILFVRRSFLDVVCDGEIERFFEWATVLEPDDTPHQDWLIANGRQQVLIRGTDRPEYRYCATCGALLYGSNNYFFLYPAPAEEVDVFGAGIFGIVITERVLPRVLSRTWPDLRVQELTLPDAPLDGLGPLPLRHPPDEEAAGS